MSIARYRDVQVPGPITRALVRRGVGVQTAQQDGAAELPDDKLLDRATALNRVVFTRWNIYLSDLSRFRLPENPTAIADWRSPRQLSINWLTFSSRSVPPGGEQNTKAFPFRTNAAFCRRGTERLRKVGFLP